MHPSSSVACLISRLEFAPPVEFSGKSTLFMCFPYSPNPALGFRERSLTLCEAFFFLNRPFFPMGLSIVLPLEDLFFLELGGFSFSCLLRWGSVRSRYSLVKGPFEKKTVHLLVVKRWLGGRNVFFFAGAFFLFSVSSFPPFFPLSMKIFLFTHVHGRKMYADPLPVRGFFLPFPCEVVLFLPLAPLI